ncbi:Gti1/Pac2 family-domain-containing protein, partial [Delphinella strobiligena]
DARTVIKGCLTGLLPLVNSRLKKKARPSLIKDGNIFCFRESVLARWTDGVVWSPNRDIVDYSLYRELNDKPGEEKFVKPKDSRAAPVDEDPIYVGALTNNCFNFRPNGLMKKIFRAKVGEEHYKVVSYYRLETVTMLLAP